MGTDDDELQDGLWDDCPACGHSDWFHPEMADTGTNVRCAECNHDLGSWTDMHRRLFTGGAMLAATLEKKA